MIVGADITRDAVERMRDAEDPRLRELLTGVVRHLHDFVRELAPSEAEWATAIGFLTQTGLTCVGGRQEFILLSDVLGVSMLLDAVNHPAGAAATESTVFGPFYSEEQPERPFGSSILLRDEPGKPLTLRGHVLSEDGTPLANTKVEVWQTAANGLYDVQDENQPKGHLRATFRTDEQGRYQFVTVTPVSYAIPDDGPVGYLLARLGRHPNRPAHIHFMISAPGHARLVTHLFIAGDPYLESDAVFGVKPSLVVAPYADESGDWGVVYDFVLGRARSVGEPGDG